MNWTKKQKQVIDARNRNLLVSAAAGSGKTAVLVERIVQLISDSTHPIDIDKLLVMTFTNAAAAEMRERISLAIEKKLGRIQSRFTFRLRQLWFPTRRLPRLTVSV